MTAIAPAVSNYLWHLSSPNPHSDVQTSSANTPVASAEPIVQTTQAVTAQTNSASKPQHHPIRELKNQLGSVGNTMRTKAEDLQKKGKGFLAGQKAGIPPYPGTTTARQSSSQNPSSPADSPLPGQRQSNEVTGNNSASNPFNTAETAPGMGRKKNENAENATAIPLEEIDDIRMALVSSPPRKVIENTMKLREEAGE